MRVRFSTWCALGGALMLHVGCSGNDKGDGQLADAGTGGDMSSASTADASPRPADGAAQVDASGSKPGADASATITTIAATTTPAACSGELPPATALFCPLPDPYEPNNGDRATGLLVDPTCTIAEANLTQGDTDSYRFEATLSDPVLVELDYLKRGDTALSFDVGVLAGGNELKAVESSRNGALKPQMQAIASFEAEKGATYDVSVKGKLGELCQPYTLRVNAHYCTDEFEDNDTEERATTVEIGADGARELKATVHSDDDDFYRFTVAKADPVLVTASYPADDGDRSVAVQLLDAMGASRGTFGEERTGTTRARSGWVRSDLPDRPYRLKIFLESTGECAPYTVKVDTAACTDSFEDNDTLNTPAKLTLGEEQRATVFPGDHDHYDVSGLAGGGTCVVTFTPVAGGTVRVETGLYDAQGTSRTTATPKTVGSDQVITFSWADISAKTVSVTASGDQACQPYTLRCSAPVAPAL